MKKTVLLAVTFGFVFLAFTQVHAAIMWDSDSYTFRYEVVTNSSNIYTDNIGDAALVKGPTPAITNPEPVNSSVSSTSGTDNTGLGMVLKAGAGGSHLGDGVKVHAYAEISTTSGGVLSPYGVDTDSFHTQDVIAFSYRYFCVDTPEMYNLTAQLTGSVNDPEFHDSNFLKAEYNWQGGVILRENIYEADGSLLEEIVVADITFDQLIAGDEIQVVNLRTDDGSGHVVDYKLESEIDIDSTFRNFCEPLGGQMGDITAADIGFLGTEAVPLDIEATITPVPIPGAAILLLSGITVIVGIGNRKKKV
ncbi:MAG: hypothetical protein LWX52_00560 [Deltaproteobacteria bacterium]|jgi:hypothetical protein|nr:hypothetical protein [Deltaproteobacteria bacterium]